MHCLGGRRTRRSTQILIISNTIRFSSLATQLEHTFSSHQVYNIIVICIIIIVRLLLLVLSAEQ